MTGIGLSLALSVAFLAACLLHSYHGVLRSLSGHRVTAPVLLNPEVGPVLTGQLATFSVALVGLHLALGLLAWVLARLSESGWPARTPPRRRVLVAGWFTVLTGLVLLLNAAWYPASRFVSAESFWRGAWLGWPLWAWPVAAAGGGILLLWINAARRARTSGRLASGRAQAAIVAALVTSAVLFAGTAGSGSPAPIYERPHIVIIGLDSLRDDLAGVQASGSLTPNVDRFLADAHRFTDTTTPLARTFPAWVSLLSGRHPVATGTRFNLVPRDLVREGETLGDTLRGSGYHTVYATDEVRFANIDESYGFDLTITPPVGAIDFLLGIGNDLPLSNVAVSSRAGGWLFPANYANRAASVTYRPDDFVARVRRELRVEGPTLLALHLTLPHWPYAWAGRTTPTRPDAYRAAYRDSVTEVDRQFGELMRVLEAKGIMENAIVVVFSDHGEALGGKTDTMLREIGTGLEIWNSIWGHGTSVMSPHQYGVLLAMRAYGQARLPGRPGRRDWPVTLEDLRPTLQDLAIGTVPGDIDGLSLRPYLDGRQPLDALTARIRYTETGFNTAMVLAGDYQASGLISEGAGYYRIDAPTGRVQLRRELLAELIRHKERAAMSSGLLLAAVPSRDGGTLRYFLTGRHEPAPRLLGARPDPAIEAEAARLWDALHARFPGELPSAADVPRM